MTNSKLHKFIEHAKKIAQQSNDFLSKINFSQRIDNFAEVSKQIDDNKIEDTYNSLKIEEFDVSHNEIGDLFKDGAKSNNFDLLGYKLAFDYVKKEIQYNFLKSTNISEDFIQTIQNKLYEPIIKYNIKTKFSPYFVGKKVENFKGYRNCEVMIKDATKRPPSHKYIPEYMDYFLSVINKINDNKSVNDIYHKAIIAHYLLVIIHPFNDGNGRTARLLMNYILSANGLPWIVIKFKDRAEYFEAISKSLAEDDYFCFLQFFINKYILLKHFK